MDWRETELSPEQLASMADACAELARETTVASALVADLDGNLIAVTGKRPDSERMIELAAVARAMIERGNFEGGLHSSTQLTASDGIYGYLRVVRGALMIVAANNDSSPRDVVLPAIGRCADRLRAILGPLPGDSDPPPADDDAVSAVIPLPLWKTGSS